MKLTDTQCKNAKPAACAYKMFDGGGLYLEVMPNGSKLWRQKYYYLQKEKRLSLGHYPLITLADGPTARYVTHMFDMCCQANDIKHRLTKPNACHCARATA